MRALTRLLATFLMMTSITACNSGKERSENPFFESWTTPYGVPPFDKITSEHYMPAFERGMSLQDAEIKTITDNKETPTFENTLLPYDNSGKMLAQVKALFEMLCSAEINDKMQALQEQIMPRLSAHNDKILLDAKLFARIGKLHEDRATLGLDTLQLRLLEKTYTSFVRAGALLEEKQKTRLKQINEELSLVGVKFGNNILAENNGFSLLVTEEQLNGLPTGVRDAAKEKATALGKGDQWAFTLHKPSMLPFLTYSTQRELREKLYTAYLSRCNNGDEHDNKQLINDFIRLRTEKAHLLGYPSYAHYVTANQMSGSPAAVYELLEEIWTPALKRAKEELREMDSLLQRDHSGAKFEAWDWWYYAEKVRMQNYSLDEEMLRPYFALSNVQSGIFFLANRLYGITFRPIVVPIYHPEVTAYEVLDTDNSHLGVLYFDFFPRDGKSGGAWCGNYTEQLYQNGQRIAPVVSIVCNFTRPTQSTPALLTLDETETLFHEFGHALHFLFHDVKYRGLAEVEGDFVELPSQIMENWAFEPEVLKAYAIHYNSNEVIPDYLIAKLRNSALFNQGFITTELIASSLSDMDIHSITDYKPLDVMAFEHEALAGKRGLIPQIEPRYHYPYFSHIFDGGYSAGYYFYTWAEVLDKDAFESFRQSGDLFNRTISSKFRRLLSRGGMEDGMTLYRTFRGGEPDKRPMLRGRGLIAPEPIIDTMQITKTIQ